MKERPDKQGGVLLIDTKTIVAYAKGIQRILAGINVNAVCPFASKNVAELTFYTEEISFISPPRSFECLTPLGTCTT